MVSFAVLSESSANHPSLLPPPHPTRAVLGSKEQHNAWPSASCEALSFAANSLIMDILLNSLICFLQCKLRDTARRSDIRIKMIFIIFHFHLHGHQDAPAESKAPLC